MEKAKFAEKVLAWYDQHGRKHLPWQQQVNPYRVWVSEIMLQQTQVSTVLNYFPRFMHVLPTVHHLANAPQDEILHLWTGLGYYSRARNLQHAAQLIVKNYQGVFPQTLEALIELPGIGRSTAGAILSLAMNKKAAILDGNVKRVLTRYFAIQGYPNESKISNRLWALAEELTPTTRINHYTQAMMDLGAMLCTRNKPNCPSCPLQTDCLAYQQGTMTLYPTPKPKKVLPQKHIIMPLYKYKDTILLYQRPNTGLWGGLWSLPELTTVDQINTYAKQIGLNIKQQHLVPTFTHTFSHFQLTIEAWIVDVDNEKTNEYTIWYNIKIPPRLGLAAPIKKLLSQIH